MSNLFSQEVPKARVNITLDVDTKGQQCKKELPFKILVIADFSSGGESLPIAKRERINVNRGNLNQVIAHLAPKLMLNVVNTIHADASMLSVKLNFSGLDDFHPEQLINQVPELKNLLAMRNLLKDFKANLIDNENFRIALDEVCKNKRKIARLHTELQRLPLDE